MNAPAVNQNLLQDLWNCTASAEYAADKLAMINADPNDVLILRDCAGLCTLAARMHVRGSMFTAAMLEQCLKAASMCAGIEVNVAPAWMEECVQRCIACVQACETFLSSNNGSNAG